MKVHTRHARCTRPAYGTTGDSLRELEPAEHIQADPLTIIRSIERAEIVWTAFIFLFAWIGIGAFFAIGSN